MKVLLIDNYDSFTYNLVHYLEGFDCEVTVWFNDQVDLDLINTFDKIVLSPGPGLPKTSGVLMKVIEIAEGQTPILGVCLGFQAIIEHKGGSLFNQNEVKHGRSEKADLFQPSLLFKDFPATIAVGLYHSWAANEEQLPDNFIITAKSEFNIVMAVEDIRSKLFGVQFHPESILTEKGREIIQNFLEHS